MRGGEIEIGGSWSKIRKSMKVDNVCKEWDVKVAKLLRSEMLVSSENYLLDCLLI